MYVRLFLFVALIACLHTVNAQKLVTVTDNILTINPRTSSAGNTDVVEVILPAKTKSIVYRISVFRKEQWPAITSLSALLDSMGSEKVLQTQDLRFLAHQNTGFTLNAFIFTTEVDARNFYNNESRWRPCKNLQRTSSIAASSTQCIGKKIYFGFSNSHAIDEIDVRLEVVSITE